MKFMQVSWWQSKSVLMLDYGNLTRKSKVCWHAINNAVFIWKNRIVWIVCVQADVYSMRAVWMYRKCTSCTGHVSTDKDVNNSVQ